MQLATTAPLSGSNGLARQSHRHANQKGTSPHSATISSQALVTAIVSLPTVRASSSSAPLVIGVHDHPSANTGPPSMAPMSSIAATSCVCRRRIAKRYHGAAITNCIKNLLLYNLQRISSRFIQWLQD